ncbi:MAG: hypothetical protein J7604_14790 [Sporocytophaga sp.]|uniref:tetratricopeptide repeat protein n=1 Tax=Sporocytophaga sp. TaxID=2231183 RepID=UPI001B225AFA|nr:hypothetical protein [Sporocytophaga sp.]MBO9701474.1 hypothetical protein [Sporocytophaga sp.]
MNNIYFWKSWKKSQKLVFISAMGLSVFASIYFFTGWYLEDKLVIQWEVDSNAETLNTPVDTFVKHLFKYTVESDSYLLSQTFKGSNLHLYPLTSYIYFGLSVAAILLLLTTFTYLDLIWYGAAMLVFTLFLSTLKTDLLGVFKIYGNQFLAGMLVIYLIPSYYFQAFKKNTAFSIRLGVFTIITLILGIIIGKFSDVSNPFYYMANFGIAVPIALTMLFLFLISFEIINSFVFLTAGSKNMSGKNSILNFIIISALYLGNLLLLLLKKMLIIQWDSLILNAFWIFLISAIVGLWGYKKRAPLFYDIIPFRPFGAYFYIGLAIVSLSVCGYAFISANDPLKESIEYAIIYSHLGIGATYFLYIIYNFYDLFPRNVKVYDVVYQPKRLPFFMVRGIGFVVVLALFLYSNRFAFYLCLSGYNNGIGDVYLHEQNILLAKHYYREGVINDFQNHRSNYSLGVIAEKENNKREAVDYFASANVKRPMAEAYVNLSRIYFQENMFFPALFTLQEALQKFPDNGMIQNNLGLLYMNKSMSDSTYFHLTQSEKNLKENKSVAAGNILNFLTRKGLTTEADSISSQGLFEDAIAYQTNKLSILNFNGKKYQSGLTKNFINDSILSLESFSYLNNITLNHLKYGNKEILDQIKSFAKWQGNEDYKEQLTYLSGLYYYYNNEGLKGKEILDNIRLNSSFAPTYNSVLGLWMMQHDLYKVAIDYFSQSKTELKSSNILYYAISLMETGDFEGSKIILMQLSSVPDKNINKITENLLLIINTSGIEDVKNWTDELKLQFIHYKKGSLTTEQIKELFKSMSRGNAKIEVTADLMEFYLSQNKIQEADYFFGALGVIEKQENDAQSLLNRTYLKYLAHKGEYEELNKQISKVYLNERDSKLKPFFSALYDEAKNNTKDAMLNFNKALQLNPFNEEVRIAAALFYQKNNQSEKAYDILLKGIEINKYSVPLIKAYALQAVRINLVSYGESILEDLKLYVSPSEFSQFTKAFQEEVKKNQDAE